MFSQFKENMEINQGIHGPNQIKRENLKRIGLMIHTKKTLFNEQHKKSPNVKICYSLKLAERRENIKRTLQKKTKRDQREIINLIH